MKKILSLAAAALLMAGLSSGAASAKHQRHHHHHHHYSHPIQSGVTTERGPMFGWGNNAELMGNNGNSASGDNSLGHIKGGNIGAGE